MQTFLPAKLHTANVGISTDLSTEFKSVIISVVKFCSQSVTLCKLRSKSLFTDYNNSSIWRCDVVLEYSVLKDRTVTVITFYETLHDSIYLCQMSNIYPAEKGEHDQLK